MKKTSSRKAFSLVELMVAIAIIGILAAMIMPQFGKMTDRAQSVTCMNNLKQVGASLLNYVNDNDNTYPMIEPDPGNPVYTASDDEDASQAVVIKDLLDTLSPYGLVENVIKCPADIAGKNPGGHVYFNDPNYKCSYQWRITADDEIASAIKIYGGRRGYTVRVTKPSRVVVCTDFNAIHPDHRMNRLYADGHVKQ